MVEMSQIVLFPKVSRKPNNIQVDKGEPAPSFPGEGITVMSLLLIRNQRIYLGEKLYHNLMCSKMIQEGLPVFAHQSQSTTKDESIGNQA